MKNTLINRKATIEVAKALGDLNDRVVYVGGAVVSLYINDPAADDVRPTKDIDITFEVMTVADLEQLREDLDQRGFKQSHEEEVICRFRLNDSKVDVMSTHEVGWAPANPWFRPGFERAFGHMIEEGLEIKLMPFEYFLASKFEAYQDRGGGDPRTSHDFEDIVYLLNYTKHFSQIILHSDLEVQAYLIQCFKEIQGSRRLQEGVIGNLYYEDQEARFQLIMAEIDSSVSTL